MQDGPIAILAGGAGGLAVADHLERLCRTRTCGARRPGVRAYAGRPPRVVVDRVTRLADDLVAEGAKVLVLASAAATGDALGRGARPPARARCRCSASTARSRWLPRRPTSAGWRRSSAPAACAGCRTCRRRGGRGAGRSRPSRGRGWWSSWSRARAAGPAGAALVQAGLEALRAQQDVAVVALACAHAAAVAAHVHAAAGDLQVVDGAAVAAERTRATLVRAGLVARRRRRGRRVVMTSWPDRAGGLPAGVRGGRSPRLTAPAGCALRRRPGRVTVSASGPVTLPGGGRRRQAFVRPAAAAARRRRGSDGAGMTTYAAHGGPWGARTTGAASRARDAGPARGGRGTGTRG